jgi:hypothetical protein
MAKDKPNYLNVKHGEWLPVVGGSIDGAQLQVEKFLVPVFGEDSPPAAIAIKNELYGVDCTHRVFRLIGHKNP